MKTIVYRKPMAKSQTHKEISFLAAIWRLFLRLNLNSYIFAVIFFLSYFLKTNEKQYKKLIQNKLYDNNSNTVHNPLFLKL